eukprot:2428708-Pleurochrysis_carterae.AAC.1
MSCIDVQLQRVRLVAPQTGAFAAPSVQRCRGRALVRRLLFAMLQKFLCRLESTTKDALDRRLGLAAIACGGG